MAKEDYSSHDWRKNTDNAIITDDILKIVNQNMKKIKITND